MKDDIALQVILKGKRIFNPVYQKQEVEEYEGNPYIEALPPIFDDQETADQLLFQPKISPKEKMLELMSVITS